MFLDQQMPKALQLREKKNHKDPRFAPRPGQFFMPWKSLLPICLAYMLPQWSPALVFVSSTWSLQEVSHPSTIQAQCCLTSGFPKWHGPLTAWLLLNSHCWVCHTVITIKFQKICLRALENWFIQLEGKKTVWKLPKTFTKITRRNSWPHLFLRYRNMRPLIRISTQVRLRSPSLDEWSTQNSYPYGRGRYWLLVVPWEILSN